MICYSTYTMQLNQKLIPLMRGRSTLLQTSITLALGTKCLQPWRGVPAFVEQLLYA